MIDLDWRKYKTDIYECLVKPLDYGAYQRALAILTPDGEGDHITQAIKKLSQKDMAETVKQIFATHVKELKGPDIKIDGDIRKMSIEDLTEHGYFMKDSIFLLSHLLNIATLTEPVKKKSGK